MAVHRDFGVKMFFFWENGRGKGLQMIFLGEMAMQMDFWVKDGVWEKIAVQRDFWVKIGF